MFDNFWKNIIRLNAVQISKPTALNKQLIIRIIYSRSIYWSWLVSTCVFVLKSIVKNKNVLEKVHSLVHYLLVCNPYFQRGKKIP